MAVVIGMLLLAVGAGVAAALNEVVGARADATAEIDVAQRDGDAFTAWAARVLLLLAVAWVAIGMLAARTRLVRRPGAAAARASWLGSTRPWRARESTLGMLPLDRWLMILVPGGLLVATRAVQAPVVGGAHVMLVLGAWLIFAGMVRALLWHRSPWPVIAAVGGAVVLRCILLLAALSFTGPGADWFVLWTDPAPRGIYVTLAVALFLWAFVVAGWALSAQLGRRRAVGAVLAAVGAALAIPAIVVGSVGVETALAAGNDEIGLLPWGLSRVVGSAVSTELPAATPWMLAGIGAAIAAVGLLLALVRPSARRP